jgi:hypothetical protein
MIDTSLKNDIVSWRSTKMIAAVVATETNAHANRSPWITSSPRSRVRFPVREYGPSAEVSRDAMAMLNLQSAQSRRPRSRTPGLCI